MTAAQSDQHSFAAILAAAVALLVLLVGATPPVSAQSSAGQFSVKEHAPRAGTSILRDAVRSPRLPINKRFSELTEAERAQLAAYYPALDANAEPPYPEEGLRPLLELAAKAQNKLVDKGRLMMWVSVDAQGVGSEVKVVSSPSPEMTKALAGVLLYAKFKPARCAGVPCAMDFPLELVFPDNAP